jgi:[protein-PII] uridylyltransferase
MQLNLDHIRGEPASRLEWRQLTALRAPSLASLRKAKPFTIPLEALSPFAHCDGSLPPAKLLAELRTVLETTRDAIRDDFEVGGNGIEAARRHSDLMDVLVSHLLELAGQRVPSAARKADGLPLAVAAVGGYGRAELAPCSDIDLLFLVPEQSSVHSTHAIEFVLYRLWDLGLKVGHAVRSVGECVNLARSDWRTGISLLDIRYLWGRRALYDDLAGRFRTEIAKNGEALVDALLCDLAQRHARFHDPAAPDVKRGQGGLRDMQTLHWLGKIRR